MVVYQGIVQNGRITIEGGELSPDGTRVQITVIGDDVYQERGITVEDLLKADFIGVWEDRDDIGDTATFAEELRWCSQQRD